MENQNVQSGTAEGISVTAQIPEGAIIIPQVTVVKGVNKSFYSCIDTNGVERVLEVNKTSMERAYAASIGDPKYKDKGVIFFQPRTQKWVRCKSVEEAIIALTPKAVEEKKPRNVKPSIPSPDMLVEGQLIVETIMVPEEVVAAHEEQAVSEETNVTGNVAPKKGKNK